MKTGSSLPMLVAFVLIASPAGAQERAADLDDYYRFPVSVGAEYRSLQAFRGFATAYTAREIASELRLPLPFDPVFQPFVRAGTLSFVESGSAGGGPWDHDEIFASAGLAYSSRFSKNFELGIDLAGGYSQTYFGNLAEGETLGSGGWFADVSARIALIPSYHFAVDIKPSLRYARTLGPLTEFDGFYFGVGFSLSYRFGQDPDAPSAAINAFRLASADIPPVFAAMRSYYAARPLAAVSLSNEERFALENVEVSFFQGGYMDAPTPAARFDTVRAGARLEVPILAAFNQEVFKTEGTTPMAGELIVRYRAKGRNAEQRFPLSYELMDKTAIVWDDDRKVGAFITPSDSALRNYGAYVRQTLKEETLPQLDEALQTAAQVYAGLATIGIIYQADPTSPFVKAQAGAASLDSVSLGRDTLLRGAGDCDDLTVLFASILETMGIETAFITVPGHIYPAFAVKAPPRDFREIHPERSFTIVADGKLWVPVEITLVGKQGFADAWRRGAELWSLYDNDAAKRSFVTTAAAQAIYRPVALRESDLGLQYGSRDALRSSFRAEIARVGDSSLAALAEAARKSGDKKDYNALGIASALYGRLKDAEAAFQRAIRIDPQYVSAQVNLGNVSYLQKDYRKALASFNAAVTGLTAQGRETSLAAQKVLINLSKTQTALANFAEARNIFEKALAIDPARVREFEYLAQVGAGQTGTARASETKDHVLFLADD